MIKTAFKYLPIIAIVIILFSCRKYEDGPGVSLRKPEKRISQVWELKSIIHPDDSEELAPSSYPIHNYTNSGKITYTFQDSTVTGDWYFFHNKTGVTHFFDFVDYTLDYDFDIQRLTSKEMWLKTKDNDILKFKSTL